MSLYNLYSYNCPSVRMSWCWCSPRSCELDVLALWVRCLVGKWMLASCISFVWVCNSATNVGATRLSLVRLSMPEYMHRSFPPAPRAYLVWMCGCATAMFWNSISLGGWLEARDFTRPLRHVLIFFCPSRSFFGVYLASTIHHCVSNFLEHLR